MTRAEAIAEVRALMTLLRLSERQIEALGILLGEAKENA
jgi:hypothetical protein